MSTDTQRVLFVCTHNSARSQMAEGMLRAWGKGRFEALSAGTEATHVRPEAVAVMAEIGIDISDHASKTLEPFLGQSFNWLITVCDQAQETCPTLPGVRQQAHWSIDEPLGDPGLGRRTVGGLPTSSRRSPRPRADLHPRRWPRGSGHSRADDPRALGAWPWAPGGPRPTVAQVLLSSTRRWRSTRRHSRSRSRHVSSVHHLLSSGIESVY